MGKNGWTEAWSSTLISDRFFRNNRPDPRWRTQWFESWEAYSPCFWFFSLIKTVLQVQLMSKHSSHEVDIILYSHFYPPHMHWQLISFYGSNLNGAFSGFLTKNILKFHTTQPPGRLFWNLTWVFSTCAVVRVTGWLLLSVAGHHLQPGLTLLERAWKMTQTEPLCCKIYSNLSKLSVGWGFSLLGSNQVWTSPAGRKIWSPIWFGLTNEH